MSKRKGDLAEEIVAHLHELPGVNVSTKVRLPQIAAGRGKRGREFDVVLEQSVAGYRVLLAIECKNERKRIGAPKIDAFAGKLQQVGLSPRHGIFVSVGGFTEGALEAAAFHGIRTLKLVGIELDGLRSEVHEALWSCAYLLCTVSELSITNSFPGGESAGELLLWYVGEGFRGSLLDSLAGLWQSGAIPRGLGRHDVSLPLPAGAHQMIGGERFELIGVQARVEVRALVVNHRAEATTHALVNASSGYVEKLSASVRGPIPSGGRVPVEVFETEAALQSALATAAGSARVVERVALPRIVYGQAYWPLSRRASERLRAAVAAFEAGSGRHPSELTLLELEGSNLAENWSE